MSPVVLKCVRGRMYTKPFQCKNWFIQALSLNIVKCFRNGWFSSVYIREFGICPTQKVKKLALQESAQWTLQEYLWSDNLTSAVTILIYRDKHLNFLELAFVKSGTHEWHSKACEIIKPLMKFLQHGFGPLMRRASEIIAGHKEWDSLAADFRNKPAHQRKNWSACGQCRQKLIFTEGNKTCRSLKSLWLLDVLVYSVSSMEEM